MAFEKEEWSTVKKATAGSNKIRALDLAIQGSWWPG